MDAEKFLSFPISSLAISELHEIIIQQVINHGYCSFFFIPYVLMGYCLNNYFLNSLQINFNKSNMDIPMKIDRKLTTVLDIKSDPFHKQKLIHLQNKDTVSFSVMNISLEHFRQTLKHKNFCSLKATSFPLFVDMFCPVGVSRVD